MTTLIVLYVWYRLAMLFLRNKRWCREHFGPVFYVVVAVLSAGVVVDFGVHILSTIVFLDLPRLWEGEWTLSQRLERYHNDLRWINRYHYKVASFICERWLNPYHYKRGEPHC